MNNRTITGFESLPESIKGCVLTIGNFDGVHRGHQVLINTGKALAVKHAKPLVALTFDPPPDIVVRPKDKIMRVMPLEEKVRLLHKNGADFVVVATADKKLLSMEPEQFERNIILEKFEPTFMVEGHDFCYGKKRAGSLATLAEFGRENGFQLSVVDKVEFNIEGKMTRISSTKIRELICAGNIKAADEMLGRPFELIGPVVGGEQVGRVLEFPTANIDPGEQVFPREGVYAGWATLKGKVYTAAISIGTKPTTGEKPLTIEANLLDATGDFYGCQMRLRFYRHLRDQMKFDNLDQLKAHIAADVAKTRELCPPDFFERQDI